MICLLPADRPPCPQGSLNLPRTLNFNELQRHKALYFCRTIVRNLLKGYPVKEFFFQ